MSDTTPDLTEPQNTESEEWSSTDTAGQGSSTGLTALVAAGVAIVLHCIVDNWTAIPLPVWSVVATAASLPAAIIVIKAYKNRDSIAEQPPDKIAGILLKLTSICAVTAAWSMGILKFKIIDAQPKVTPIGTSISGCLVPRLQQSASGGIIVRKLRLTISAGFKNSGIQPIELDWSCLKLRSVNEADLIPGRDVIAIPDYEKANSVYEDMIHCQEWRHTIHPDELATWTYTAIIESPHDFQTHLLSTIALSDNDIEKACGNSAKLSAENVEECITIRPGLFSGPFLDRNVTQISPIYHLCDEVLGRCIMRRGSDFETFDRVTSVECDHLAEFSDNVRDSDASDSANRTQVINMTFSHTETSDADQSFANSCSMSNGCVFIPRGSKVD